MTDDSTPSRARPSVLQLFAQQVSRTPAARAVADASEELSYAELDRRSRQLSCILSSRGAGPGVLVAVLLDPCVDSVVAVLAVLRSGAGYVPLSPQDPPRRLAYILADSQARLILTAEALAGQLLSAGTDAGRILYLDSREPGHREGRQTQPTRGPEQVHVAAWDVAYVIYTSGSTGAPKGVVVGHGALSSYLAHAKRNYPAAGGRVLLHSSVSFDMAVTSLYTPLISGGCVELAGLGPDGPAPAADPGQRPTLLKVTPSHLPLLEASGPGRSPTEQLVVGGEMLVGAAIATWRQANPAVLVVNEYGPTEATVGCCAHYIQPGELLDQGPVPIGKATEGTRLYVLDDTFRLVPQGTRGELYIAGDQLARGYLGRPGLTAGAFLPDPFGPPGTRMYRSGDLARHRADGNLEYLGRTDKQLKIQGYRVEPGEIVAAMTAGSLVAQAAVAVYELDGGGHILIGYVVPAGGLDIDPAALRLHLSTLLPEYMIPAQLMVVTALPLTANGKLDVSALPRPAELSASAATNSSHADFLYGMFAELTGAAQVGPDDDFFVLGGTSLDAARLVARARRAGMRLTLRDVLARRTVRQLTTDGAGPAARAADECGADDPQEG
jgi:amino acid adenylation domain-containing protein